MKILSNQNFYQNESAQLTLEHLESAPENPKKGQMYYNTTTGEGYVCTKEATFRSIESGDLLNNKTIFFDFPDGYTSATVSTFIRTKADDASFYDRMNSEGYSIYWMGNRVYWVSNGVTKIALPKISLRDPLYAPDDNAVVTSIDITNAAYAYVSIIDEEAIWEELGDSTSNDLLTALGLKEDTYNSTQTYSVGDMVVYNHIIYECTTAITTAEDWNVNHWEIVPIITN